MESLGVAGSFRAAFKISPAIFTAFGCQVVIAPVVDYFRRDAHLIRRAFFWGTLIPLLVYCLWILASLAVLRHDEVWAAITMGRHVPIATIMESLARGSGFGLLTKGLQGVSFLALLTSFFGVGVSLVDDVQQRLKAPRVAAGVSVVVPICYIAFFSQVLFVHILSVAGVINTVIAVFLPMYIMQKVHKGEEMCGSRWRHMHAWRILCVFVALSVVLAELGGF